MKTTELPQAIIIWYNPGSTNAHRTRRLITQLQHRFPGISLTVVDTKAGDYQGNQTRLADAITASVPDTWLIVAGGDGTVGSAVNVLQHTGRTMPLLPFAAGNSNDIATILHGRRQRVFQPGRLLKAGVSSVRPLVCTVTSKGKATTLYAVMYVSFGITAHTAKTFNAPDHRDTHTARDASRLKRRLHEIRTFMRILNQAEAFHVEERGESKALYERLFVNGPRMAKYFRWPILLTEPAFHEVQIDSLKPADNMQNMRKMASGHLYGRRFVKSDVATFTAKTAVAGQLDGETIQIPAGAQVTVALAKNPMPFISLR